MSTTLLAPPTLRLDLTFKQAADASLVLTLVDANGQPITNPVGYTIQAQIRETQTGPVLFEWNSFPGPGMGTATLTYAAGPPAVSLVTLTVTKTQSNLFTFSRPAQWDCFLTNPIGQATCLAEGVITIDSRITSI